MTNIILLSSALMAMMMMLPCEFNTHICDKNKGWILTLTFQSHISSHNTFVICSLFIRCLINQNTVVEILLIIYKLISLAFDAAIGSSTLFTQFILENSLKRSLTHSYTYTKMMIQHLRDEQIYVSITTS